MHRKVVAASKKEWMLEIEFGVKFRMRNSWFFMKNIYLVGRQAF